MKYFLIMIFMLSLAGCGEETIKMGGNVRVSAEECDEINKKLKNGEIDINEAGQQLGKRGGCLIRHSAPIYE